MKTMPTQRDKKSRLGSTRGLGHGGRRTNLGDGQCGAPLCLENVKADAAVTVDVRVVDARSKCHLGARIENVERKKNQGKPR